MFECLSSLMAGNPLLSSTILKRNPPLPGTQNSFVAAIDISFFTDLGGYRDNVDALAQAITGLPTVPGADALLVPGDPEERVRGERVKTGIPLPPGTVVKLKAAATRFGLKLPPGL